MQRAIQYCGILKLRKYNGGKWTEARFNSFIKSILRSGSRRWEPKYTTLNESCTGVKTNIKTGRQAKHFRCNKCLKEFPAKDVQVDHIEPIINPSLGFTNWTDVIENMYCEKEKLQVLCTECHKMKTATEKGIATERKRNAK